MAKKKANLSEIEKLNMEYLDLKLKNSSGSLKETHKLSELRKDIARLKTCLLYTSPSPRDMRRSRMPSSA